ncbi:MAG: carbohydrate kinase [Paludibacter sp.]|nr:carbohydrate kinase [Paludibacter sp.]
MKNVIVGIGEILWDMLPGGKVLGGAPANFAYHVSQLGFHGYAVSAIGKDELGEEISDSLIQKDLRHDIQAINYPTGTVKVTLDNEGIPQYEICENVAWDNIPFSASLEALACEAKTVCFGSLAQRNEVSRNTIQKFLNLVPDDAWKIFDINLRQHFYTKEIIETSLHLCHILKINDDEIKIVAELCGLDISDEIKICDYLIKKYQLRMVVLTKGTHGSFVVTSGFVSFKPTPVVNVVDTVGAGDSFTAAFVASLLKGKSIEEAHALAVEVSAYVCTQSGAMPVLPQKLIEEKINSEI